MLIEIKNAIAIRAPESFLMAQIIFILLVTSYTCME